MKLTRLAPPVAALAAAALFTVSSTGEAFNLLGWSLGPAQRDFRVFNNFADNASNNNQTPDANFPGAQGAVMAIWKASVEWGSIAHGDGNGDPHQPNGGLGSGGANFDPSFQGEANSPGNLGENVHSPLSGSSGGVLAFAENNGSGLWRIRYFETWIWNDGPNTNIGGQHFDLQSVACHEYGHALGLDHSQFGSATMAPTAANGTVTQRSISNDDSNGVQAIYGVIDPVKPIITALSLNGSTLTISGSNFDASNNTVWFTREDFTGNGAVLTVNNVSSSGGGTSITVTVPSNARSGDILVRNTETQGKGISNAWPLDLDGGTSCPAPNTYCLGAPNSVSLSGSELTVTGSQDTTINDTTLTATFLPSNQFGIFIYGMGQASLSVGDGTLCVASPLIRLPAQPTGTGTMSTTLDFNNLPIGGDIAAGETWNFQAWYRDAAGGPAGNNLSSAVQVQFCN